MTRDVVQFFRDWYFRLGFEQVFAYAQTWDAAHDVPGVTWFVTPACYALGTPAYKGKLWYVRAPAWLAPTPCQRRRLGLRVAARAHALHTRNHAQASSAISTRVQVTVGSAQQRLDTFATPPLHG